MNAKAGWFETDDPKWLRWWDGTRWNDAYWPVPVGATDYLPDAERIDISTPWPNIDVVGENYREDSIASLIGGQPGRDVEVERFFKAELIPEPDNPHAPNRRAISVRIAGQLVGYLPNELASEYWEVITRFIGSAHVPTVTARIWAVTRWSRNRNRDELKSAIRLALPDPDEILPANDAPRLPHRLIPRGRSLQVTGEEDHVEVLAPYSQGGEPTSVVVTLHPLTVQRARSEVTVVEVHLDGERVGQMTPASSAPLLRLIAMLEDDGLFTAAWGQVTGSRFAAEVKVSVCKPEKIPDSWPSDSDRLVYVAAGKVDPPPAWVDDSPIEPPPPGAKLPWWGWASVVVAFLLLVQIPFVGPILGLSAIGLGIYWAIKWKQKPSPRAVRTPPQLPVTVRAGSEAR